MRIGLAQVHSTDDPSHNLRTVEDFTALLQGAPRPLAGDTAPARGLALVSVDYGDGASPLR